MLIISYINRQTQVINYYFIIKPVCICSTGGYRYSLTTGGLRLYLPCERPGLNIVCRFPHQFQFVVNFIVNHAHKFQNIQGCAGFEFTTLCLSDNFIIKVLFEIIYKSRMLFNIFSMDINNKIFILIQLMQIMESSHQYLYYKFIVTVVGGDLIKYLYTKCCDRSQRPLRCTFATMYKCQTKLSCILGGR